MQDVRIARLPRACPPVWLLAIAVLTGGCGDRSPAPAASGPEAKAAQPSGQARREYLATHTRADLAERMGRPVEQVTLLEVRPVHWRSAALGCPDPDRAYAQVVTPGYLVRLAAGGVEYRYHAGEAGEPFMCPPRDAQPWLERSAD